MHFHYHKQKTLTRTIIVYCILCYSFSVLFPAGTPTLEMGTVILKLLITELVVNACGNVLMSWNLYPDIGVLLE